MNERPFFCDVPDDSETDFDEDDGADGDGAADGASSLLLHELNEGPVIEREPVDKEIPRGDSLNSSNNAFVCGARNALSVQVRCSPKNLSEPQATSGGLANTTEGTERKADAAAEEDSVPRQQQPEAANGSGSSLVVPSSTVVDLVDPMTGVRHIEIQAVIDDRVFAKFQTVEDERPVRTLYCTCYAWSSKGQVISRIATVKSIEGNTFLKHG